MHTLYTYIYGNLHSYKFHKNEVWKNIQYYIKTVDIKNLNMYIKNLENKFISYVSKSSNDYNF